MRLLSSLIKGNNLTISEPKVIVVENYLTATMTEDFVEDQKLSGENAESSISNHSVHIEETRLQAQCSKLREELESLQLKIDQKLKVAAVEAENLYQEAEKKCQQLEAQTQQEIEMLKAQTMEESIAIQSETYEKAYQDGLKQAQEDIENDRQLALAQVKEIIEAAEVKRKDIINQAEPAIVELSMAVAKKIVAAELGSRPELIIEIVKEAIDNLDNPQNVRVQVNPKDELYLSGQGKFITSSQYGNVNLGIIPDDSIERGGCVVESNMAVVDSRLENRINNVENLLNEVLINEGTI